MNCPPCTQDCRQGRDCPAYASDLDDDSGLPGPAVALCLALGMVALAFGSAAVLFGFFNFAKGF